MTTVAAAAAQAAARAEATSSDEGGGGSDMYVEAFANTAIAGFASGAAALFDSGAVITIDYGADAATLLLSSRVGPGEQRRSAAGLRVRSRLAPPANAAGRGAAAMTPEATRLRLMFSHRERTARRSMWGRVALMRTPTCRPGSAGGVRESGS